jgi:hypothetical protein
VSAWLAATVALWPAGAAAQTTARSFEELMGIVTAEQKVIVTDVRNRRVKGALTAIDEGSLSLATDGLTQTFARSEVSIVQMVDGLANGALIGAGLGFGAALGILAVVGSGDDHALPSAKIGAPLLLSGIGALVGGLVDRVHQGGRILYASPGPILGLVVSPFLDKDRHGVLVSVRF